MRMQWDDEAERLYHESTQLELYDRVRILAALGALLFPLFSFLDYFTQREHLYILSIYRFTATVVFLGSWLMSRFTSFRPDPVIHIYTLFAIATVSISLMCVEIGGFKSPYYGGINLILIAAALILPVNEKLMTVLVAIIIGIYVFFNGFWSGKGYDVTAAFINNMYFLLTTGFICVIAAYLAEKLRRESFLHNRELERTQNYLKGEIQTSQDSIENMLKEISMRRVELEKALAEAEFARNETQKALQVREDFISLASHELNTPLTSLKLQTQVAQMRLDTTPAEEHSAYYRKIVNTYDMQLKRLIHMVDDMLDVSRIKKGKFDLDYAEVPLATIIKDIIERTPKNNYQIKLDLDESLVVTCDMFRMEQVVLNLFTNAMKYGAGKPIEVHVKSIDGYALIEVKDNGIGIPEMDQKKIFGQFERAVKPQEYTGLGLGLFISKQIVDAHQGQLEVESLPGRGSTFRVILPKKPTH